MSQHGVGLNLVKEWRAHELIFIITLTIATSQRE